MHHFFTDTPPDTTGHILMTGDELRHMNVLRLKPGEEMIVNACCRDYVCVVVSIDGDEAELQVKAEADPTELPVRLNLYQGLPKGDKMELIIQKAVELGAYSVVPVEMKRSVSRPDEKKKKSKQERWQSIARSAAEQSGRGLVPEVSEILSFGEALARADGGLNIVPYENAAGMAPTEELLNGLPKSGDINIFIGPEGGFDPAEIEQCVAHGVKPISLGKRILRTETAGIAILAALMLAIEINRKEA